MRTLGVIGGLGPMATAFFMQMVIEMTEADTDQEHIEMIVYHCPSIPDRTSYILGESKKDPEKPISAIGRKLAEDGAEIIAIPCVTACCFYERLSEKIAAPVINLIDETAQYLEDQNINTAGLMATDGTRKSGLFQSALQAKGIQVVLPKEDTQRDIMHLIYQNVKAGRPIEMERFERASEELREKGAQVILLGCTELSMIRRDEKIGAGYLDVMQILAKSAVEQCGTLKKNYQQLITQ
ncbi:MAG: amino acid racemase [Lachnospiraceae bacterium]|nr:amino acid racemase [Lachnospiraceae bacterium]